MEKLKYELTEEQKDALLKLVDTIKVVVERVYKAIMQIARDISNAFRDYIMSLQPRERYKLLKRLNIKNYAPYFRRGETIRCRNNY